MPVPFHPLPDCPLETVRSGTLPGSDRRAFLREAGTACARYVREGGDLQDLNWEHSRVRGNRIELHPVPRRTRSVYPDRKRLEAGLTKLMADGSGLIPSPQDPLIFLTAFQRALSPENPDAATWVRGWLRKRKASHRDRVRTRYHLHFHQSCPDRDLPLNGLWIPDPKLEPEHLLREVETLESPHPLNRSRRARVWEGDLLGHRVVVKRFNPNPSTWRRRWEVSRARRAWVGACVLQELGILCSPPLGWLECRESGKLKASYLISRQLFSGPDARTWFRKNLKTWNRETRIRMRHHLREEIRNLHLHGISHRDLKLSNLLVRERPGTSPVFYWIDLEDLRVDGPSFRSFVRNLYQLNGSLPRDVTREERLAFVRGFHREFPWAGHPLLHRFVEHRTRKRLRRELRRICGA